jgi:hypothetical protein
MEINMTTILQTINVSPSPVTVPAKGAPRPRRHVLALAFAAAGLVVAAVPSSALAQPGGSIADAGNTSGGAGIGVGAAAFLSGVAGPEVVYDQSRFHIEGLLGFRSVKPGNQANPPTQTTLQFGVRGWYHLSRGVNSDFSVGGGVGVQTFSGTGVSQTATALEPGIQARVFLTPNFTLHVTSGLSFTFGDNVNGGATRGIALATQFLGGFGFAYFFR